MATESAREPQPEPPERTERAGVVEWRAAPAGPAARVLQLQRQAGNRAVATLLARDPTPKAPAKPPPPAKPAPKESHVILPGLDPIVVQSVSLGPVTRPSTVGRADKEPPQTPEVHLQSEQGEHSSALWQAATGSDTFPSVTIVFVRGPEGKPYLKLKLTNAYITSLTFGGARGDAAEHPRPFESWTLKAEKIEYETMNPGAAAP